MKIHHAPWSRWFKTMHFKGTYAYELQVGPLVFQLFHNRPTRKFNVWKDPFWR